LNAIIGEKFCGVDIYTLQVSLVFSGQRASLNHAFFAVTRKPDTGSAFADFSLNNYQSVIKLTHILTQISRPTKLIRILPTSESCDVRNLPILLEIAVKMGTQRQHFFAAKMAVANPFFCQTAVVQSLSGTIQKRRALTTRVNRRDQESISTDAAELFAVNFHRLRAVIA
jgi:hypothetical protein